jgi:lipoprotein-anchoring transpeptidase ErfK/SrfK
MPVFPRQLPTSFVNGRRLEMHGKGEKQGCNTSADMRRRRQIVRARPGPLRYSKSALPISKIRSFQAVQKRILSAHCLPRIAASAFVVFGVAVLIAAGLTAGPQPAAAQQGFGNFFSYQGPPKKRVVRKRRAPAASSETAQTTPEGAKKAGAEKTASEKTGPKGAVYAIVSLPDQHMNVYDATGRIASTRVSTGQSGYRTPAGIYSVIGKSRYHRSNIYSGAPMPWMQRITWSGIAMHAGVVPGYPASHGCIRLPYSFAPVMFNLTKMGARVVVVSRDTTPVDFAHDFLPLPKMQPAPAGAQQAAAETPVKVASVDSEMTTAAVPDTTTSTLLNPIAYAGMLKDKALADKTAADQTAKDALAAAQAAGAEARQAVDDVRAGEAAVAGAEAKIAAIDARMTAPVAQPVAATPTATGATTSESEKATAQADLNSARAALTEARAREAAKTPGAFAAVEAWKRAAAAATDASDLVDEAERRRSQVSVFISRKEGRIFIRQNWKEVWEAPVTFRDPDRPLGTHIYTAADAAADGSAVKWVAISVPAEGQPPKETAARGKDKQAAAQVADAPAPETAAGALDRIELPQGARERIAELLWTGGSLIVSDNPRSYEMGEYTDFIVLTR